MPTAFVAALQEGASMFMPHGMCYLWRPGVLWTNVVADAVVAFAYFAIPPGLLLLGLRLRRVHAEVRGGGPADGAATATPLLAGEDQADVSPRSLVLMLFAFGVFIVACGLTHVMAIWTVWSPSYWTAGGVKAVTAVASLGTALALPPLVPKFTRAYRDVLLSEDRLRRLRRAHEDLERSGDMLRRVFDTTPVGMAVVGLDGRVHTANPALRSLVGESGEGLYLGELFDAGTVERLTGMIREVFQGESPEARSTERLSGSAIGTVNVVVTPFPSSDGEEERVLVHVVDISEEVALRREVERYAQDLERSNGELEQFAYVVSHDLQEPLRMVSGFTELLRDEYQGRLDENADRYIGFAADGARRMSKTIQDLLTLSRVGANPPSLEATELSEALDAVERDLGVAIAESGATIERGPLAAVEADPGRLSRVLMNLVSNAIRYSGDAAPHVRVEAEARPDGRVDVRVSDRGIGIASEHHEGIFKPFKRLAASEDAAAGTGIGLAIVARIVEQHGGSVRVESEVGRGTTMSFDLAAAPEQE